MDISLHQIATTTELEGIRELYLNSFPTHERREFEELKEQLAKSENQIFQILSHQAIIGFISLWNFDDFVFVEHFAIIPKFRSQGIGRGVIKQIVNRLKIPLLLEVEPPTDEASVKRINFYQTLGFSLLPIMYMQPSYDGIKPSVELKLMTTHQPVTDEWVKHCVALVFEKVYTS